MEITPKGAPGQVATSSTARGCYGLQLRGVAGADRFLCDVSTASPALEITTESAQAAKVVTTLWHDRVLLALSDGASSADLRREGTVHLRLAQEYDDEALLHPLLSSTYAVYNWWHGRDALHAGAFVTDGKAWVVIGERGKGKSTTLAALALAGVTVLCDDVVVEVDGYVLPGPGFVDLRGDAGAQLASGRDVGMLGGRARQRLDLPPGRDPAPLAGFLTLDWGDEVHLRREGPERAVPLLLDNRALNVPPASPETFLRYATLPMYTLVRRRDWATLSDVVDVLTDLP